MFSALGISPQAVFKILLLRLFNVRWFIPIKVVMKVNEQFYSLIVHTNPPILVDKVMRRILEK